MDKNIKAELWTLRNEVLTNLKNIEGLVGKIDTKLAEEDETSCLSRCPEIARLLDLCHGLNLHPDTPPSKVLEFRSLVDRVTDRLSIIQVDRYTESMAELLNICKKIDSKVGKLPAESPMEALWESRFPGVREKVEEYLEETDPVLKPKEKPVEVDDKDIKNALDRMNARMDGIEKRNTDPAADPDLAPEWAKDVDQKSGMQIFKEAAEWDEDSQILFGRMWNRTARTRIDLMEQVMADTIDHVRSYNYYNERVTIKNQEEARKLVSKYDDLENAKERVVGLLRDFDRDTIKRILANSQRPSSYSDQEEEHLENWVLYYDWYARLVCELERVAAEMPQGAPVASSCLSMLKAASADSEMTVLDPKVVDPNTFEIVTMKMPADKLDAFRRKAHADYMRDLKRAYDWRNRSAVEA